MYPFSARDIPGPECGVFFISIVDLISKSALVLFSILCAINYHYNNVPLKVEFFKCKMIHNRLLLIAVLQKILLQWVINNVNISIISRYTWRILFCCYFPLTYEDSLVLLCFILNYHVTFFSTNIKSVLLCIFRQTFFAAVKEIHKLQCR